MISEETDIEICRESSDFYNLFGRSHHPPFHRRNALIEDNGQEAQHHNGCDDHCHGKGLGTIRDEVAQAGPGGEKFPDDDPHQAEADVDLHAVYDKGQGAGEQHLEKDVPLAASQGSDELDLLRIHLDEAGVQGEDGAKDRHGYGDGDNGPHVVAQPDDEQGGQCGFWQAV